MKDVLISPLKLLPLRAVTLYSESLQCSLLEVEQDAGVVAEVFGYGECDKFVRSRSISNELIAFWAVIEKVDSHSLLTSIVKVQHVTTFFVHLYDSKLFMGLYHAGHVGNLCNQLLLGRR